MKNLFKKPWLFVVVIIAGISAVVALKALPTSNDFTDFWTIKGIGSLRSTSIAWIDSGRDFHLYDGDISLGAGGTTPGTTAGAYPQIRIPIYNASNAALAVGDVVIALASGTSSGYGTTAAILATTTVLGVAAEAISINATGMMAISGYALVKTTGAVPIGGVLVSTNGSSGTGAVGYAGLTTGTQVVGTSIGKAMSVGTAAGGTTLVLLNGK